MNIPHYENASGGIETLHNSLFDGTSNLINYIQEIVKFPAQSSLETSAIQSGNPDELKILFRQCDVYVHNFSKWVNCSVNAKVQSLIKGYDDILTDNVVKPLDGLDAKSKAAIGFGNLTKDVKNLQTGLNKTLAQHPRFWSNVTGKDRFFTDLNDQVKRFWTAYQSKIYSEDLTLKKQISKSQIVLVKLNDTLGKLNKEQENIEKRISEFDTPIGKLYAGFNDVITIFPFALAGGFLVCTSILVETMRFRRDYFKFHPKEDKGNILREDEVARTAPLWLDPKDKMQNKIMRNLVLVLPLVIYSVSIIVIAYSWSLPGSSFGTEPYFRMGTMALYIIVGLVTFGFGLYYTNKEYSRGIICDIKYTVGTAASSGYDGNNISTNAFDGRPDTKWQSTSNAAPFIIAGLTVPEPIARVDITWADPNTPYLFDIALSNDNVNFITVYSGARRGYSISPETYRFRETTAKYVKITVTRSTVGSASITAQTSEIAIYKGC